MERAGTFQGVVKYRTDLFKEYTIRKLASNYVALLEKVAVEPETTLGALREFAAEVPEEERRLIEGWNATAIEHDRTRCLHSVLEQTALATPDAPAVTAGSVTLSYRELDDAPTGWRTFLRRAASVPGALVAICLDRTVDMPVALAAVLKAGAAYVPLDPTHPAERLRYTLEDAGVACAITLAASRRCWTAPRRRSCCSTRCEAELATQPETTPGVGVRTDDFAYVIYTSGSTGRPKGVQVEHRNVVNFLESMRREPGIDRDGCLARGHDAFVRHRRTRDLAAAERRSARRHRIARGRARRRAADLAASRRTGSPSCRRRRRLGG